MMKHLSSSESGVLVIIPDHEAKGMLHETKEARLFMPEIEDICLEMRYRLMIIANGPDPQALVPRVEQGRERLRSKGFDERHLVLPEPETFAKGTVGAAQKGYDQFLMSDDSIVVKMDNAEHAGEYIPSMVDAIRNKGYDSVVADLDFLDTPFKLGECDQMADKRMAAICARIGLPFTLSHAHGYLAYGKHCFDRMYATAKEIHDRASLILGKTGTWGFDLSTILASELEGRNQLHDYAKAKQDRIRDKDLDYDDKIKKADAQEERWITVTQAFLEIRAERSA